MTKARTRSQGSPDMLARGRRAPYAQIGVWVILAPISSYAGRVYDILVAHVNSTRGDHCAWPTQETMAMVMGCSQPTISRAVKELCELGAIEKVGTMPSGQYLYLVHETPPDGYAGLVSIDQLYATSPLPVDNSAAGDLAAGSDQPGGSAVTSDYSGENTQRPGGGADGAPSPRPGIILPSIDQHSPQNVDLCSPEYKLEERNQKKETNVRPAAQRPPAPGRDGRTERADDLDRIKNNPTPAEAVLLAALDRSGLPPKVINQPSRLLARIADRLAAGWPAEALAAELTGGLARKDTDNPAAMLMRRLETHCGGTPSAFHYAVATTQETSAPNGRRTRQVCDACRDGGGLVPRMVYDARYGREVERWARCTHGDEREEAGELAHTP